MSDLDVAIRFEKLDESASVEEMQKAAGEQFARAEVYAKQGKIICLSDLIANAESIHIVALQRAGRLPK